MNDLLGADKIGQDKIQNPDEYLRRTQGTYDDAVNSLGENQRYPMTPRPPEKSPFGSLSNPVGPGRGGV
jgi:hypothetical protein